MSGRSNIVNALNRGPSSLRVGLDPAVAQLEDLPRGLTSLKRRRAGPRRRGPGPGQPGRLHRRRPPTAPGWVGSRRSTRSPWWPVPDAMAAYQRGVMDMEGLKAIQLGMIAHCEPMGNRMAILDAPPGLNAQHIKDWRSSRPATTRSSPRSTTRGSRSSTRHGRQHLRPAERPHGRRLRPQRRHARRPQGAGQRGGARRDRPEGNITKGEQDVLNPVGVNCIRAFPGRGIRVWGARTLSTDPAWRYLNVRRLFNYLEDSIMDGTQWAVFEPNDQRAVGEVRRSIAAVPGRRVAQGRALRPAPGRGVLRQVRRRDQPARGDRPARWSARSASRR